MGEVVGDLKKLRDMIAVNDTEINFIALVLTKIEELLGGVLHATKQLDGNGILQTPTEAVGLKYIIVVGNESRVDGIGFALGLALDALEGEFGDESQKTGVFKIGHIIHDGMDGTQLIVGLEASVRYFLTEMVEKRVGYLLQGFLIAHLVALANVLGDDGSIEGADVFVLSGHGERFRETSLHEVGVESMEQKSAGFGGEGIGGYSLGLAVFGKGEGEQAYLVVSAGEMGGEFSAEQIGIAAGKDKVNALAQQVLIINGLYKHFGVKLHQTDIFSLYKLHKMEYISDYKLHKTEIFRKHSI